MCQQIYIYIYIIYTYINISISTICGAFSMLSHLPPHFLLLRSLFPPSLPHDDDDDDDGFTSSAAVKSHTHTTYVTTPQHSVSSHWPTPPTACLPSPVL